MNRCRFIAPSRSVALIAILCLFLSGCITTVGSRTVEPARMNYNEAIADSWDQQLLLNLVRMRYRDTTFFMEVSSIVTQYGIEGSLSGSASVGTQSSSSDSLGADGSLSYSETPTVTYTPLQGEDFVRRLLSEIPSTNLSLLSGAGWSIERLLLCCVDRLNRLENATTAAGPTPDLIPRYKEFQRAAELLRQLQIRGAMSIMRDANEETRLQITHADDPEVSKILHELTALLNLGDGGERFQITRDEAEAGQEEISFKGRSLLGALYYISQSVEPPPEHEKKGWVTVTRNEDGSPFNWQDVTGSLMRIRSSDKRPDSAFVRIRYRGTWFYIDDSDLNSKTTFALMSYLFTLQSVESTSQPPVITISAGG